MCIRVTLLIAALIFSLEPGTPAVAQEAAKSPPAGQPDEFQQAVENGRVFASQGRVDEAIAELRRAAKLRDGNCSKCFETIGLLYFRSGKYKDAAPAFRQSAELKPPNEAQVYNILGVALYMQNEKGAFTEAAAALQRAIDLSKGQVVKAYYNLGFALIKAGKEQEGIAALKKYLEVNPDATEASQARAVAANPKLVDARFAQPFVVKSHKGDDLSLEKLRGKVVLLDFWASWCLPCRVDIPEVKKIWTTHGGDQFTVIGINLDSNREQFETYMKEEGITWLQYYDGLGWGNKISQLYGVYAI
ncbi:MAG: tetratricopeptide repeat protein, partial [Blastocatellia bacterium]